MCRECRKMRSLEVVMHFPSTSLLILMCGSSAISFEPPTTVSPDVVVKCHLLLEKFTNASADFTRCAGENAKPISMCRRCVGDLLAVSKYYESLSHASEGGVICRDIFTSQDSVEIISEMFDFVAGAEGLWSKAHCSRCYTEPLTDASNLTEETREFFSLFEDLSHCFQEHPVNKTKYRNTACDACNTLYQNLSTFFKDAILGEEYPFLGSTCFDILDAMNITQKIWGEDYNCGRRLMLHVPLLISVIVITTTSLAFYIVVGCLGSSAEERVLPRNNRLRDFLDLSLRHNAPASEPLLAADTSGLVDTPPGTSSLLAAGDASSAAATASCSSPLAAVSTSLATFGSSSPLA